MKSEAIKEYLTINGELVNTLDTNIFDLIEKPIYEVIRVIDGIPLFLEDHLVRMRDSAKLVNKEVKRDDSKIIEDIKLLIENNHIENLNIKLLVEDVGNEELFLAYLIESYYPDEDLYNSGIHTILYKHERDNPNAKILKTDFKEDIKRELAEKNAFEAILVNNDNTISEGSRSNMFFVKNNKIYTAPAGNVLMGITRKYILKASVDLGIEIIEENINVDELNSLEGAFMSGTSVDVLPISTIDDIKLNSTVNTIIKKLISGYREYMRKDLDGKK